MKRQIKFRQPVLDNDGKFMYFHYWGYIDPEDSDWFAPPLYNDKLNSPEQFAGLQDTNGNDIYEGDVVKVHYFGFEGGNESEHEAIAKVFIDEHGTLFHFVKSIYNFRIGDKPNIYQLSAIPGLHDDSFEIIGNIHQNP